MSDDYETSDPLTIGGATGQYAVPSPYHTECEWCIVGVTALGTFGATTGVPAEQSVPATAGNVTLFTGAGILTCVVVTATGTANLNFQDGAGNIIAVIPAAATLGQIFLFNAVFGTSLVAQKTALTPVVTASFIPASVAGSSATYAVGSKNPNQPSLSSTGGDKFGSVATSGPDSNNALPAYVGALTATAPFVTFGGDNYMPLPSPASVYLTITTPATTELLVTLQFRRSLDRVIPEKPRQKPHTHTHVKGRREYRGMVAGFAAQYPEEGIPYEHQPLQPQDTGMARRGVFPLGPTDTTHRKVGRNGR